jgi:CDGSH-type Zn-finger protein
MLLMARIIILNTKGPTEIKPEKESVWICRCGLSKNQPFCDGSHKAVADEDDDKIYEYDEDGHRKEKK